jgi:flagellar biosynthesis/type III secretory pathway protein FliH
LSPERALRRLRTRQAPSGARLAEGDLASAFERALAGRERAARAAGLREGERAALAGAASALDAAVARFDAAHASMLAALGADAVDLALEIARQILRSEIRAGRYEVGDLVRETLAHSRTGRGRCTVHLHPDDAAQVEGLRLRSGTLIEPDSGVARGSVHVETPQGLLVREADECLAAIAERLGEARSR